MAVTVEWDDLEGDTWLTPRQVFVLLELGVPKKRIHFLSRGTARAIIGRLKMELGSASVCSMVVVSDSEKEFLKFLEE